MLISKNFADAVLCIRLLQARTSAASYIKGSYIRSKDFCPCLFQHTLVCLTGTVLESKTGPTGGVRLPKRAITAYDVWRAISGNIVPENAPEALRKPLESFKRALKREKI